MSLKVNFQLMADYNQFIWRSEATHSETADDIETDSWYISAGYRMGKFLPRKLLYSFPSQEAFLPLVVSA